MVASGLCLPLLLGWALLLGQPAWGMKKSCCHEQSLPPTDEELEERASQERRMLEETKEYTYRMESFKQDAMRYINNRSPGPFYKHLEDTHYTVKKAVGIVTSITLYVTKTNCTREDMPSPMMYDSLMYYGHLDDRALTDLRDCQPLPVPEVEQCTFQMYMDAKSGRQTIFDYYCTPVEVAEEDED